MGTDTQRETERKGQMDRDRETASLHTQRLSRMEGVTGQQGAPGRPSSAALGTGLDAA